MIIYNERNNNSFREIFEILGFWRTIISRKIFIWRKVVSVEFPVISSLNYQQKSPLIGDNKTPSEYSSGITAEKGSIRALGANRVRLTQAPNAGLSQAWFDEQIKSIFVQTRMGGSKILKKVIDEIKINLEWYGYNVQEKLSEILNSRDIHGKTPLEYAIDQRSFGHVKVLVESGASVTSQEVLYAKNTYSPLNKIIDFLQQHLS